MPDTILVVEDEPALRDTLSYNLKKDGFTVEAASDDDRPRPGGQRRGLVEREARAVLGRDHVDRPAIRFGTLSHQRRVLAAEHQRVAVVAPAQEIFGEIEPRLGRSRRNRMRPRAFKKL